MLKLKPRPEPLGRLRKYLEDHNIKMIDVFRKFAPDNSTLRCLNQIYVFSIVFHAYVMHSL